MTDQKPFHESIVSTLDGINSKGVIARSMCEAGIDMVLGQIKTTIIPDNHDNIIKALDDLHDRLNLPGWWKIPFEETKASVLAQKEVAKKVAKYEGTFIFFESDSLMKDLSQVMNPLHGITGISFKAVSTGKLNVTITLPIDFTDIIFGTNGLLDSQWIEKFHRVSGPPLHVEKEQTNIIGLPDNCILSFEDGRWWHEVEDAEGSKHECYRHEALELVEINSLKRILTDEAWADIIKPDQPLLQD